MDSAQPKSLSQPMEEAMADGRSFVGWVVALEAERDRLAYTNEKLRDALVFVVRGLSANDALLAAGLDPFPILTGAPR